MTPKFIVRGVSKWLDVEITFRCSCVLVGVLMGSKEDKEDGMSHLSLCAGSQTTTGSLVTSGGAGVLTG